MRRPSGFDIVAFVSSFQQSRREASVCQVGFIIRVDGLLVIFYLESRPTSTTSLPGHDALDRPPLLTAPRHSSRRTKVLFRRAT